MAEPPSAWISHFTSRRMRIKVPEKRRNAAFFDVIRNRLAGWDSVERVETNPLTASILVHFSDAERLLREAAAKNDFLDVEFGVITQPAEPVLTDAAVRSFITGDRTLRGWTHNEIDMRSVVFVLLFAGGLYQLLRGRLSTPAPTLLWYAGSVLGLWREHRVDPAAEGAG